MEALEAARSGWRPYTAGSNNDLSVPDEVKEGLEALGYLED